MCMLEEEEGWASFHARAACFACGGWGLGVGVWGLGFGGWGLGVDLSAHCVEHHCAMRLLQVKHDVAHDVLQHMPQQARGGRHAACGGVRRRQAAANVLERAVPLDELELDGGAVGEARLQDARAVLFHGRHVPECKSMGGV